MVVIFPLKVDSFFANGKASNEFAQPNLNFVGGIFVTAVKFCWAYCDQLKANVRFRTTAARCI
jgi:hypothetical protein